LFANNPFTSAFWSIFRTALLNHSGTTRAVRFWGGEKPEGLRPSAQNRLQTKIGNALAQTLNGIAFEQPTKKGQD